MKRGNCRDPGGPGYSISCFENCSSQWVRFFLFRRLRWPSGQLRPISCPALGQHEVQSTSRLAACPLHTSPCLHLSSSDHQLLSFPAPASSQLCVIPLYQTVPENLELSTSTWAGLAVPCSNPAFSKASGITSNEVRAASALSSWPGLGIQSLPAYRHVNHPVSQSREAGQEGSLIPLSANILLISVSL